MYPEHIANRDLQSRYHFLPQNDPLLNLSSVCQGWELGQMTQIRWRIGASTVFGGEVRAGAIVTVSIS